MQPDEVLRDAQEWMEHAAMDLQAATILLSGSTVLPEIAVFHAQQAAEKALKGFLIFRGHPFSRTHDLAQLVSSCESIEPDFSRFASAAKVLTPYAVRSRYPGYSPAPSLPESEEAARLAAEIVQFVRDRLPSPPNS